MTKIKCEDCRHWLFAHEKRRLKRNAMFSFHYNYETVLIGSCMSNDCGKETSGYTGMVSSHKMSRLGNTERYCRFFEPKVGNEK